MGVVYEAEDLKLHRQVPFSVSPTLFLGHALPFAVPLYFLLWPGEPESPSAPTPAPRSSAPSVIACKGRWLLRNCCDGECRANFFTCNFTCNDSVLAVFTRPKPIFSAF